MEGGERCGLWTDRTENEGETNDTVGTLNWSSRVCVCVCVCVDFA